MTPTDKMEMQVAEGQDGGATVVLPPEITSPDTHIEQDDDDGHDDAGSAQESNQEDQAYADDPDREAVRAARREERKLKKQIHREKAKESNHLISALRKQNQAMAERLANLEKKTSGAELARVDKAIEDAAVQVEYAKMRMSEAVASQDGQAAAQAEELLYEYRRKLESFQNVKNQATRQMSQPQQNIDIPDPMVQRMAADWMEDNPWYDPRGSNEESQIAQMIDKRLTEEGYDPSTQEYWDELTYRHQKYVPPKQNSGYNDTNVKKPRSVMTSSGREATATTKSNEFRLSPQRVAAIKESGKWDNVNERNAMIRKYAEWDRQNKPRG